MRTTGYNIVLGGEAGQGLQTVGHILAKSLVRAGYHVLVTQDYESRVRGGHNTFAIRTAGEPVIAPQEPVDLLVALDQKTISLHSGDLAPTGWVAADQAFECERDAWVRIPVAELAPTKRFANVAALGVVCGLLGLDRETATRTVLDQFGTKDPAVAEKNKDVLAAAFSWCEQAPTPDLRLPPPSHPGQRLLLHGNEAIALGALSAGVRFAAYYPMAPSTSISVTLAKQSERLGLIVEQAEDEIAVLNMALGASYAGAPAMAATSGGGFALMVEALSLAAVTETPIVIVDAQRGGPATGLPTRTEQADLAFVLHAGHGEFPRVIFAPGDVEECFRLTRKAFDLAERYQIPAFVLTDQFLADSYRSVDLFDVQTLESVQPGADSETIARPYRRYALTESGVSPRLLPGLSEHLVVADSHEHTEDGHISEDPHVRTEMVRKRLRKLDGLGAEVTPPTRTGPDSPDLLLVSWGSTKGAVREAAARLRESGRQVGVLHFSQVWPLVPGQFEDRLRAAGRVVCVEQNAEGQFARLLRQETGFHVENRLLKYDGRPLTPEWIVRQLET